MTREEQRLIYNAKRKAMKFNSGEIPEECWEIFLKFYNNGMSIFKCSTSLIAICDNWRFSEKRLKDECIKRGFILRKPTREIESGISCR